MVGEIKYLEGKRFGEAGGANPSEAARKSAPWSIRSSIRYAAGLTQEELKEHMKNPKLTLAQLTALKKFQLAMQKGDVRATYADISESRRDLGFEPKTSIDEGLPKFVDWYRSYHGI